jgi:hypothetical protein
MPTHSTDVAFRTLTLKQFVGQPLVIKYASTSRSCRSSQPRSEQQHLDDREVDHVRQLTSDCNLPLPTGSAESWDTTGSRS